MERYFFIKNINKTKETGILDIKSNKLLCLCTEENSEIILKALNNPLFDLGKTFKEMFEKK